MIVIGPQWATYVVVQSRAVSHQFDFGGEGKLYL